MTLREYLAHTGTSQQAFAKLGKWRQATVSDWCRGALPTVRNAMKIERLTGGKVPVNAWTLPDSPNPNNRPNGLARGDAA